MTTQLTIIIAGIIGQYAVEKVADWVNDPRLNRRGAACVQTILDNIKRQDK